MFKLALRQPKRKVGSGQRACVFVKTALCSCFRRRHAGAEVLLRLALFPFDSTCIVRPPRRATTAPLVSRTCFCSLAQRDIGEARAVLCPVLHKCSIPQQCCILFSQHLQPLQRAADDFNWWPDICASAKALSRPEPELRPPTLRPHSGSWFQAQSTHPFYSFAPVWSSLRAHFWSSAMSFSITSTDSLPWGNAFPAALSVMSFNSLANAVVPGCSHSNSGRFASHASFPKADVGFGLW